MKPIPHFAAVLASVCFCLCSSVAAIADEVDFNRDVRPILANCCYECHGPDEDSREADLRLDEEDALFDVSREPSLIVPNQPDRSELFRRLVNEDADLVMPPANAHRKPTRKQIQTIRNWIAQGAQFKKHWAFVAPQRPKLPAVSNNDWCNNEVDQFILAKLDQESMSPQPAAAPRVLARRLSLSLTGLPPSSDELQAFVEAYQIDPKTAVTAYVDTLLASPQFGEHFAWAWLDAARYADTNGYQADGKRTMWPWRDWLIRSLNNNVPFDELTCQMLAGDFMMDARFQNWESGDWIENDQANELLLATGFLRNHRYDTGSGTIPAESKFENATDRMETVATVWMGLTFQCARCHTHKYDPIENREYYQFLSFFDNVPEVGSALREASHPYIHVGSKSQREHLKALKRELHSTTNAFKEAAASHKSEQIAWEQSLLATRETGKAEPRVTRGMRYQYAENRLQFDGTRSIKKTKEPVQLCAGNKSWTISFWFRPQGNNDGAVFSSVEEPERYRPGLQADWVNGRIRVRHVCRWVNSYIEFESVRKLQPGLWYHVSFRCDGRMQGLAYRAFLNGDDAAMRCTHPVTNDSASNAGKAPLVLGGSPLMPGFKGQLRDLRFYDRELSPIEIASLADHRSTTEIARIPVEKRTGQESVILRMAFQESEALPKNAAVLRDKMHKVAAKYELAIKTVPRAMVMKDVALVGTRIRISGVYDQLGEAVKDGTPAFLPLLQSENVDRLKLAGWLTHPDHPLTARVAVNRIWQQLWGQGFVDSPENFGTQCARPEHAKLLDWLATEYIRFGWDTKALVKLIVTSAAFSQNSSASAASWKTDPLNRMYARGPRYRLPISVVRDQALALGSRLDRTIGGPPVAIDEIRGKDGKVIKGVVEVRPNRRTIYSYWKRNAPHPMLAVFDAADRNQCDVRVRRTNTPLQSLVTLNEAIMIESARGLAERISSIKRHDANSSDDMHKIRWAYELVTARLLEDSDGQVLLDALHAYRKHFSKDPGQAKSMVGSADCEAEWIALANVLLNLDATLTLE